MGHRQLSSRSQFFQVDQHESESHIASGMPYEPMGRTVAPENASFHSIPIVPTNGLNAASRHQLLSSTNLGLEGAPLTAPDSGPSSNTLSHFPAGGSVYAFSEMNTAQAQSGPYNRHARHEAQGGLVDMLGSGRGAFKRKYPSISLSCERGSTSRLPDAGSSSNSFKFRVDKPTLDYRNNFPMGLPCIGGDTLSIAGEDSQRNVRTRFDMEINARRVYSPHPYYSTSRQQNHPQSAPITNLNIDSISYGNHGEVSAATHRRYQTSANSSSSHGMNTCFGGGHTADISRRYHNESIFRRNSAPHPQYLHDARHAHDSRHVHFPRESQSDYSQGTLASYRTGLRSSHLTQQTTAMERGPWYTPENYPSGYPRSFSAGGWRNYHGTGRSRITTGRFNPLHSVANARDRMQNEALSVLDRTYWHSSRNLFDQYRDMRLDIDNMTYEELLALGESIGNVNTGLSEDVISNCLMEITYSSRNSQDVSSCAICLEYEKMEKVGKVKNCGHEYHVDCIRKWLATKNACPICKAPALADTSNGK